LTRLSESESAQDLGILYWIPTVPLYYI